MRRIAAFLSAAAVLGFALSRTMAQPAPVRAEPDCSAAGAETRALAEVIDGGTLRLSDESVVLLAGVGGPRGLPGEGAAAAEAAAAHLRMLAGGEGASVRILADGTDRHGRLTAQVFDAAGTLLQASMVGDGFATVRPFPHPVPCITRLLVLEETARRARKGLWATEFGVFAANDPSLLGRKGLYVIVEGFVLSVGQGNRLDFLNFGRFWQRDFTVLVSAPIADRLAETGLDTAALAERRVRVRGVIEEAGGPSLRLNDFRELEILDDD